ncbi:restriction endonuclease [Sphingopyxis sp. MSC1_008]|jgi:restriction system protein|uniref:restriction endonuclease n=1 Tax=Sphingopyxis sp. MSC1_008 TaxID=2909265 RepID=UPI0020BE4089|nr:restriction endonuclease [Sphingopyxis sp. MSC1_008]
MSNAPTRKSIERRMAEARKIGRAQFLKTYASGRGSDNWYVQAHGIYYDLKALWAAAHRPPIKPISFKTYDAIPGFEAMDFTCVSGITAPHGLPGDAAAPPPRRPRPARPKPKPPQRRNPQPAPDPDLAIRPLASPVAVSPTKDFKPTGYWLFLSNPTRWDSAAWRASKSDELLYLVSKDDRNFIQPGDLGLLRVNKRRGQPAELIAAVEILEAPRVQPEPDPRFFRIEIDAAPALRVTLSVISNHDCEPVRSDALPRTPAYDYLHDAVLLHTLKVDDRIDWETLKDRSRYNYPGDFPEPKPSGTAAKMPEYVEPKIGFFQLLLGKKAAILSEAEAAHSAAVHTWDEEETKRKKTLTQAVAGWEGRRKKFWDEHKAAEDTFKADQAASHAEVDRLAAALSGGEVEAVIEHASLVLERSDYDGLFEKSYVMQYDPVSKLLKLAYDIPSVDTLPATKSVKFIKVTGEIKESFIPDRERKANFESVAYQVALRTLHEIFEADEAGNIQRVLFNGFIDFLDPATGIEKRSCLMSILVDRQAFCAIDLARVDPKTCFKSLKGVSAATLSSLISIAPVMELDTEDRRFIEGRVVGSSLSHETNLAAISWEDFEHLVRELFEKEFAARGGEVKVTQSSSDGGVDAVAFDPDPITGGKIVIQAKRYTRTVGVSAVRDLYGTIMNEGASRGILVTTADYGPDAYNFANGKPITLMNGANLLYMLERHGFEAKIDITEARMLNA